MGAADVGTSEGEAVGVGMVNVGAADELSSLPEAAPPAGPVVTKDAIAGPGKT